MKFPQDFQIVGQRLFLIPYKIKHVEKYHSWMEEPEILRLTGSERLSLDEEFDMQMDWEKDERKCTFIIMDKNMFNKTQDEINSIVGDTNLFLGGGDDDEDCTEIEVMIAEKWARRKGLAREALQMMMKFGYETLKKNKYIAKIKTDNTPSIQLFQNLGFQKISESHIFNEITLEFIFK